MDLCGICEQDFLAFCNLRRYWKTDKLHTCTLCEHEFTRDNLREHKNTGYSLLKSLKRGRKPSPPSPNRLKRGRKPRQPIRQSSSAGLDASTVEPWDLTPTSVKKPSNPTTGVENTDESVAKKPKIIRPSAISRRNRCGTDIFRRDIFSLEPVKRKQKHRATEKPRQMCVVKDTPTSVKKARMCVDSTERVSPMSKATQTEIGQSDPRPWLSKKTIPTTPMTQVSLDNTVDDKMTVSNSTQIGVAGSETPWWLPEKNKPLTPMLVLSDRRLQKTSPPVMLPLSDEDSKLIIDE